MSHGTRSNQVTVNPWSPDSDFLTTEYTEHTEGNPCTVTPCFRVFGLFRGSLVFGDKKQSVVAGLGFFKPRNTQNTRKGILARLCLVSVYSVYSVVPWFSAARTNLWPPDSDFLNHETHRTHGRESLHGYALFPCIRVVPWFPGFRGQEPIVVAGLGFFNHGIHRTHGRESLHGYSLFPCIQVVPWFPDFRGQVLIPCQYSRVAARLEMADGEVQSLEANGLRGSHRLP
jgi:hypothetical protein